METRRYPRHINDIRQSQYRERLAAKRLILSTGRVAHYVLDSDGVRILQSTCAPFELTEDEKIECMREMMTC